MYCKQLITRSFVSSFAVILIASTAVVGNRPVGGDVTDALVAVMEMRTPVENGNLADTERTGTRAIEATEKALNEEKDSVKKEKLKSAVGMLKELLSYARQGEWRYADANLRRTLKLLEELK